ncbi:MAG: DUF4097 family beta strand repeat protein, partial [Chlorobia bacterium]|nr:DUF4097 family beta strand repeat protein [Fimbriimonadaceae bacterium]
MKEEVRRIIKMVEEGKLSAEDAAELIEAFSGPSQDSSAVGDDGETTSASAEPGKEEDKKDFFKMFTETVEKIGKEATSSVNWKEIADQTKTSASKGFEALKEVGEKISKGKFDFNFMGSHETRKVELPLNLGAKKTLRIENPCGDVRIVGGFEEGNAVAVAKIKGSSVEDARDKANNYTLVIEESDELVLIKQPDMSGLSVDLTIQIPEKRFVEVKADAGDVSVLDTKSGVRINNRSGDIQLRQLNGTIEVTAYSGDLKIEDAKTPSLTIESKSGDISLTRVEGNINARTASGDLKVVQSSGKTISIEAVSGDVYLDLDAPITGSLNVRTVSGDSLVSVVDGGDCRVSLST